MTETAQSPDVTITHNGTSWTMTAEQWIDLANNAPPTPKERATFATWHHNITGPFAKMEAITDIYRLVNSETEQVLGEVSRANAPGRYFWRRLDRPDSCPPTIEAIYTTADLALADLGAQFATVPVHVVKLAEGDAS